jgi:peptidoglycan/xylan/chitin deacetylase (PgdA/CDA1 family)
MKIQKIHYLSALLLLYLLVWGISVCSPAKEEQSWETAVMADEKTAASENELKKVALTFDDGPGPDTERLLLGLKERSVKATFFVVGENVEAYPDIIRQMYADGHIIGNHTYHHVQLNVMARESALEEVQQTNDLIEALTGSRPYYLRPPYGECDKTMKNQLGMFTILWDVDPLDWCTEDTAAVVQRVCSQVKENDIILLHDIYSSSVDAALQIIDTLQQENYEFVTVEEILLP